MDMAQALVNGAGYFDKHHTRSLFLPELKAVALFEGAIPAEFP